MSYQHLSVEERERIQEMLWQKTSIREIARALHRSPSSISREIKRNESPRRHRYTPRLAQKRALEKRKSRGGRKLDEDEFLKEYVVSHLKIGWSPEQISNRLSLDHPRRSISHEAIYQYIYAAVYRDGHGYLKPGHLDLRPCLPRRRKRRAKKGQRKSYRVVKGPLPSIDSRPKVVNQRTEIGHWEDDSMVYTPTCPISLRTTNERVSGVVCLDKANARTMMEANRITKKRLGPLPQKLRQTLTRDRGAENLGHEALEEDLNIRCFFAHPYCSFERGSNENTNGLVRRFFPKGTDFRTISKEEIQKVEYLLNSRPRKRLGWKTPYEVFYELTGVALQD